MAPSPCIGHNESRILPRRDSNSGVIMLHTNGVGQTLVLNDLSECLNFNFREISYGAYLAS